jgi:hypothetical protein
MSDQPTMQKVLASMAAQAREKAQKEKDEAIIKFYGQMFDKASAYTNLIVGAGYGGIFAVWSATKSYLGRTEVLASGVALVFSLLIFIGWNVLIMLLNARNVNHLEVLIKAPLEDVPKITAAAELDYAKQKYRLRCAWVVVLVLTLVSGFGAGLILIYAFIRHLLAR